MKLRKFLVLVFVLLLLSGCKSKQETAVNLRSISFCADITYYNENYNADCAIGNNGDFTAVITKPEALAGLSLEYSGDGCKLKYNGLEINNKQSFIPENCSLDILKNVLGDCENCILQNSNGNLRLDGKYGKYEYCLTVAPTGLPISLEIPDLGFKVAFKNVTFSGNKELS